MVFSKAFGMWSPLLLVTGSLLAPVAGAAVTRPVVEGQGQQILGDATGNSNFECNLPPALSPSSDGLPTAQEIFSGEDALLKQVERHSTIVKIPSISYDDNGEPGEDPRWDVFYELHKAFAYLYPHV